MNWLQLNQSLRFTVTEFQSLITHQISRYPKSRNLSNDRFNEPLKQDAVYEDDQEAVRDCANSMVVQIRAISLLLHEG